MSKNYPQKRHSFSLPSSLKNWMLVVIAFLAGHLSASYCDTQKLAGWVNAKFILGDSAAGSRQLVQQNPQLPKPKLEFYTILTANHEKNASQTVASAHGAEILKPGRVEVKTSPVAVASTTIKVDDKNKAGQSLQGNKSASPELATKTLPVNKSIYTIQVAAFRARSDAEQLKASLLLKGFESTVQAIVVQNGTWFRVTLGPYPTREQAEKMQTKLTVRERVSGMIRKMDA